MKRDIDDIFKDFCAKQRSNDIKIFHRYLCEMLEYYSNRVHIPSAHALPMFQGVTRIIQSPERRHHPLKSELILNYSAQINLLLSSMTLDVLDGSRSRQEQREKLITYIQLLCRIENFSNLPALHHSLNHICKRLIDLMENQVRDVSYCVTRGKPNFNITLQLAWKFLANTGYSPSNEDDRTALFETLCTLIVKPINHHITRQPIDDAIFMDTLSCVLEKCAIIGLDQRHDKMLSEIVTLWRNRHEKFIYQQHGKLEDAAARGIFYILTHKEQFPQCYRILAKTDAEIALLQHAVNDGDKRIQTQSRAEANALKHINSVLNKNPYKKHVKLVDIRSEDIECPLLGWNVDFRLRFKGLPCTMLISVDGPHHFVAGTTERIPYDKFQNALIPLYLAQKEDHEVIYLHVVSDDCNNEKTFCAQFIPKLEELIAAGERKKYPNRTSVALPTAKPATPIVTPLATNAPVLPAASVATAVPMAQKNASRAKLKSSLNGYTTAPAPIVTITPGTSSTVSTSEMRPAAAVKRTQSESSSSSDSGTPTFSKNRNRIQFKSGTTEIFMPKQSSPSQTTQEDVLPFPPLPQAQTMPPTPPQQYPAHFVPVYHHPQMPAYPQVPYPGLVPAYPQMPYAGMVPAYAQMPHAGMVLTYPPMTHPVQQGPIEMLNIAPAPTPHFYHGNHGYPGMMLFAYPTQPQRAPVTPTQPNGHNNYQSKTSNPGAGSFNQ